MCFWASLFISPFKHGIWNFSCLLTTPWPAYPSCSNPIFSFPNMSCKSTSLHILNCYQAGGGPHHLLVNCSSYSAWSPCHNLLYSMFYPTIQPCHCLETWVTTTWRANPKLIGRAFKSPTMDLFPTLLTTSFTQPCAGNVLYISKPLVLLFSPGKVLLPPSSTVKIWLTFHHLSRCHHDRCYYLCGVFSRLPSKINLSLCAHP